MLRLLPLFVLLFAFSSCHSQQAADNTTTFEAPVYAEMMASNQDGIVLDVRTPQEFEKGHLDRAQNMDYNAKDFEESFSKLDKSKTIFIYCLSGGRSAGAAKLMRKAGFKTVYELNGGLLSWRAANLPEASNNKVASTGMSKADFEKLLQSDKVVLVDFYADWCAPCKKMKPWIDELEQSRQQDLKVLRIDADANSELCKLLGIDGLPVLQVYKGGKMTWNNLGYISKEAVLPQLNP